MNPKDLLHHSEFLRRMALSLIRDTHLAEDLFQQTFIDNWSDPIEDVQHPRSWFAKEIKNRIRMYVRSETRRRKREKVSAHSEPQPSTDDLVANLEVRSIVTDTVSELDDIYRKPLMLRFYEGLSNNAAAAALGIPLETMRTRLKRGLKKVKNKLESRYNGDTKRWVMALAPVAGLPFTAEGVSAAVSSQDEMAAVPESEASGTRGASRRSNASPAQESPSATRNHLPSAFLMKAAAIFLVGIVSISFVLFILGGASDSSGLPADAGPQGVNKTALLDESRDLQDTPDLSYKDPMTALSRPVSGISIEGTSVSRENGTPVSSAEVTLTLIYTDSSLVTLDRVKADAQGSFSFHIPEAHLHGVNSLLTTISATGFRDCKNRTHFISPEGQLQLGNIYLDPNRELEIAITDGNDNPISGARALFYKWIAKEPLIETFSDAQGYIRFSDEQLKYRVQEKDHVTLLITAEGWTDSLFKFLGKKTDSFPSRIVLEPSKPWIGEVVDEATGLAITGAEFRYKKKKGPPFVEQLFETLGRHQTQSDWQGHFSVPSLKYWGLDLSITVSAEGYLQREFDLDKELPERLCLKRPLDTLRFQAVEAESLMPLVRHEIKASHGFTCHTDNEGKFSLPLDPFDTDHFDRFITAVDPASGQATRIFKDSLPSYGAEKGISHGEKTGEVMLPFEKVIGERYRFKVKNMMGDPIYGVRIMISLPPVIAGFTNKAGEVELEYPITKARQVTLRFQHPNYMLVTDLVHLPCCEVMEYTLSQGYRFQNLKMINEQGDPMPHECLGVRLFFDDEPPLLHYLTTNAYGLLDLVLPKDTFRLGTIFYRADPNVRASFDFAHLCDRKEIQLLKTNSPNTRNTIKGFVRDQAGNPLRGVICRLGYHQEGHSLHDQKTTSDDGSFSYAVMEDLEYELKIDPYLHEEHCYWIHTQGLLQPGQELDLAMKPFKSVYVYFLEVPYHASFSNKTYTVWLETPEGHAIHVEGTVLRLRRAILLGMPDGMMRAVVETSSGIRYCSPYFEVTGYKPIEVDISSYEN